MLRLVLLVLGFLTTGAGAFLERRGLGVWTLERRLDLGIAGAVLLAAVAGLLALAPSRRVRAAGTVLGTLALVAVGVLLAVTIGTGLPGPWAAVVAVGSAVLALVGVAGGFAAGPPRRARPAVVGLATAGAALLVVGTCGVVVPLVVDAPVRAWSVVAQPGPDVRPAPLPAVPGRPSEVAWTWTAPDGVRDVRPAGTGVVVADDTGVTALDGPSGALRWGFHRAGAALHGLVVTPDRTTVILRHGSTGYGDDEAELLTVLDAGTGDRRAEIPLPDGAGVLRVTDRMVVVPQDPSRGAHAALDLGSGDPLWAWVAPPGCDPVGVHATSTRTTVPIASRCDDRTVVTGLDESSGRERWRVDVAGTGAAAGALRSTADGTAVVALGAAPYPVIDTTTGAVRARLDGGDPVVDEGEPRLRVEDGGTARELRADGRPLPPTPCARPTTLVIGMVVAVCEEAGGATVTVDGGGPIPLGRLATDGSGLEPVSSGVRIVPAPGAVVVAGTASGPVPVRGLA